MPSQALERAMVELDVDEAQAVAQQLGTDALIGASGANTTVWFVVICLVALAVAIALLILAGQQHRARRNAADEPSFDAYAVGDPYDNGDDDFDDLASVEIEESPVLPWSIAAEEEAPAQAGAAYEVDERENVVPLRQAEPPRDVGPEPAAEPARYAFAAGASALGSSMSSSPLAQRSNAFDRPNQSPRDTAPLQQEQRRPEPRPQEHRPMSRSFDDRPKHSFASQQDDDTPFVAPFIRDDIERSERRQAERVDGLRDDVSRQLQSMKAETATKLDLFVAAVDRKLDGLSGLGGGAFSEHDMQRVTEGSMQPVLDRIARLTDHVTGQDQRLADLAEVIERRFGSLPNIDRDLSETTSALSLMHERLGEQGECIADLSNLLRDQTSDVLSEVGSLREGMARLERAILDRATADGSVSVALSEVVRGTLMEGTYGFSHRFGNNEMADCVIKLGEHRQIAIDAGFPMEAFNQLPSRDAVRKNLPQAKAAEDQFRRAILRAILSAADKCIVPGETTDSCLLFLSSEAAYTTLHDRFGDLVRDAQRARVWLTSPSTLMGTLNLLSNLMPTVQAKPIANRSLDHSADERDELRRLAEAKTKAREDAKAKEEAEAERREQERRAMREEIKALRERASGLANELDRTRGTLTELIDTTERLSGKDDDYRQPDWAEDDREDRFDD